MIKQLAYADPTLPASFWMRVSPDPTGCWLWTGRLDRKGYGRTEIRGFNLAHRLALSAVEQLEPGLTVDHGCGNKRCVNPGHLNQLTPAENNRMRGERSLFCSNGHLRPPGDCRECALARSRRYKQRLREVQHEDDKCGALKREIIAEIKSWK